MKKFLIPFIILATAVSCNEVKTVSQVIEISQT